ncbi:MAG: 4Fe-4S single cluster domain-containing protein [Thermogemmata sp.]
MDRPKELHQLERPECRTESLLTSTEIVAQIAQIVPCTEAEGPGRRFAVWFQGCPLRCPGCCNPDFLPFAGGKPMTVTEILELLDSSRQQHQLEGITLLGGEPTAQPLAAAAIARGAWERGLTVLLFSGFTLEQLREKQDPAIHNLLAHTDILVDGPYDRDQPETQRRWIGSANQRVHFLTSRCAWDERWFQKNTLEIRVRGREIIVNGYPAASTRIIRRWQKNRN